MPACGKLRSPRAPRCTGADRRLVSMRSVVHQGRYTAALEGDFVVFLIGMRINRPWKPHKWLPVFLAMPRMLLWLRRRPQAGLLSWGLAWIGGPAVVQYWRSFEDLDRFARAALQPHVPAWRRFNRSVRATGDVGIWHETYKVRAGEFEAVYANMPRIGLGAAGEHQPVSGRSQTAPRRIGGDGADEPPVAPYENP